MAETEKRAVRPCDSCGGVDDHPRHVFAYADGDGRSDPEVAKKALKNASEENWEAVFAHFSDDTTTMKHMDCCREDGCPDGTCDAVTKGAEDLKGAELVAHLTKEN